MMIRIVIWTRSSSMVYASIDLFTERVGRGGKGKGKGVGTEM